MWTRAELKARAKVAFKANYWKCVLVALILMLLAGSSGSAAGSSGQNVNSQAQDSYLYEVREEALDRMPLLDSALELADTIRANRPLQNIQISIVAGSGLVVLLLSILVFNPLIVGGYRFFLQNSRGNGDLRALGAGFQGDWGNVVLTMFLKNLFTFLWALLFIIPGIVKAYAYRMVPYILKERPELSGTKAITLSRQMMKGQKWNVFVLDLSFLGWNLLSLLTLGILGIFYVAPYERATDAELYKALCAACENQVQ